MMMLSTAGEDTTGEDTPPTKNQKNIEIASPISDKVVLKSESITREKKGLCDNQKLSAR